MVARHFHVAALIPMLIATILPSDNKRKSSLWLSFISFFLFLLILSFLNVWRWLVREDPLQKADAIAVLSGRMPGRALEAARLYKQGYAPQVWLSYSLEPGATLKKYSVPYSGEETYDRLLLLHQGVPEAAIHVLEPPIVNTADEVRTFGLALKKDHLQRIILVTSRVHTRRTAALWRLLSANDGQAIVRGVSDDAFDASHWWRSTGDALDVVREVLGLFNTWARLPLKPAS